MSSSAQRRSTRKRATSSRIGDLDSSPSNRSQPPNKKRKAMVVPRTQPFNQTHASSRQHGDLDTESEGEADRRGSRDGEGDDDEEQEEDQDLTELITRYLDVAPEPVVAAEAYRPEVWEAEGNVHAFAKISGRHWTYFVRDVRITIGRQSEEGPESESDKVHIDLGPNKMISRLHAEIYFEPQDETWYISVNGRNGVKVNNEVVKRQETHGLQSGDILGIAGTQMLFKLASGRMRIPDFFRDKMGEAQPPSVQPLDRKGVQHLAEVVARGDPFVTSPHINSHPAEASLPYPTLSARMGTPEKSSGRPAATISSSSAAKKRSPSHKKGMMIESTEQIDYSLDSSKDIKPGCSYASMITWAILSTSDEAISLSGIYAWIKSHYAYYRLINSGWQNSIRHNLSLNQNFIKVPRRPDEPGKGMKWALNPETREDTIVAANRNASKGGGRTSSAPGSPSGVPVKGGFAIPQTSDDMGKTSPRQRTPPLSSYPVNMSDACTPPRGSQNPGSSNAITDTARTNKTSRKVPTISNITNSTDMNGHSHLPGHIPVFSDGNSPGPRRSNGPMNSAMIMGSSPTLTSGLYNSADMPLNTPAPRPYNLTQLQPNTVRLPTSHMLDSSPAPFWKPSALGFGSTPARWPDSSPQKSAAIMGAGGFLAPTLGRHPPPPSLGSSHALPPPMSSSPPPLPNGNESPTRRPASLTKRARTPPREGEGDGGMGKKEGILGGTGSRAPSSVTGGGSADAEEGGGGIDLMKGFTKISTFHQPNQRPRLMSGSM